jgi:hypothetical protein
MGRQPDLATVVLPPAQREGEHGDRGKRTGDSDLAWPAPPIARPPAAGRGRRSRASV